MLLASAALIGVQLWLFVWAPLHGKALDVSMGYFLLPLAMVLVGRVAYAERLSRVQTVAVVIAALGVAHELFRINSFSWATALVVFGRSEEHTSELQSLMRISYAVFCLKKKT